MWFPGVVIVGLVVVQCLWSPTGVVASDWVPRGRQYSDRQHVVANKAASSAQIQLTSHSRGDTFTSSGELQWLPVNPPEGKTPASPVAIDSGDRLPRQQMGEAPSADVFRTERDHPENVAVVLEAPVVDQNGSVSEDPMQDPFGDVSKPSSTSASQALTPLTSEPQIGTPEAPPKQLEVLPSPPPLTLQSQPSAKAPVTTEIVPQSPAPKPAETTEGAEPKKTPQELLEGIPPAPVDRRPMEEQLTQAPPLKPDECPPFGRMRRISEITNDISAKPGKFPKECPLQEGEFTPREWEPVVFTWKASGLCHKPLYFEQVAVERYGHSLGPILQHVAAGTHFFLTIPILPYKMGLNPPDECVYPLGYYRPGSCAPWILDPIPLSVRAALAEGGVWTGMVFLIP